eukprot:tig00020909_g15339.t1
MRYSVLDVMLKISAWPARYLFGLSAVRQLGEPSSRPAAKGLAFILSSTMLFVFFCNLIVLASALVGGAPGAGPPPCDVKAVACLALLLALIGLLVFACRALKVN